MIHELSRAEIDDLLSDQVVGRIGCHTNGVTYVVPVIYAYDREGLYVASMEGQKNRMMRGNPSVCFEVDEYDGAGSWRSAIVQGVYEELDEADAQAAIALLASRFGRGDDAGQTPPRHHTDGAQTIVFRIRIRTITGRAVAR